MNMRSMKILGVVAAVLILGVVLQQLNDSREAPESPRLLPDLETGLDELTAVAVASGDDAVTLRRTDEGWIVSQREDYPADVGKLREALVALAEAETLEAKTRNPELHDRLGLAGADATTVTLHAGDSATGVVLGNSAQRSYRYARLDSDDQAWLINRNPEFDAGPADWLLRDLVDVKSGEVVAGSITHADGETIRFERSEDDSTSFDVLDIPEGRELSYPGVVNGIANALSSMELDDVRKPDDTAHSTITEFRLDDGLVLTVTHREIDGEDWFGFAAHVAEDAAAMDIDAEASSSVEENSPDAESADDAEPEENRPSSAARASEINTRLGGWLYRLPSYKSDQLTKRWEDLLKAPPATDDE